MKNAICIPSSILGVYAGLLAIEHGIFEMLQGNTPTRGFMIHAIGSACQPESIWHACFPALTVIPNFFVTGIIAVILGLSAVVCSLEVTQKCRVMLFLSALILLFGGGFVPAYIGLPVWVAYAGFEKERCA